MKSFIGLLKGLFVCLLVTVLLFSGPALAVSTEDVVDTEANQVETVQLAKPTAKQVFRFVTTINQYPETDRSEAENVLAKWIEGDLVVRSPVKVTDEVECAACIAACCGFFSCNPACIAGCIASPLCQE